MKINTTNLWEKMCAKMIKVLLKWMCDTKMPEERNLIMELMIWTFSLRCRKWRTNCTLSRRESNKCKNKIHEIENWFMTYKKFCLQQLKSAYHFQISWELLQHSLSSYERHL